MAQVFPRQANDFARASLVIGGVVAAAVLGSFFFVWPRSSYMTRQKEARTQAHGKKFRPAMAGVLASLGGLYRSVAGMRITH